MKGPAVAVIVALVLAGCTAAPGGEVREAWRAERPPTSQIGEEGSFQVRGDPWHLRGAINVGLLPAPFTFLPAPDGDQGAWMFFTDARLPNHPSGLLVVEGGSVAATAGTLAGLDLAGVEGGGRLTLDPQTGATPPVAATLPAGWSDAERPLRRSEHVASPLDALQISGHVRALLWLEDEAVELDDLPPFQASGWRWMEGSGIEPDSAHLPMTVSTDRFALGGDLSGSVNTESRSTITDPAGVFGNVARITFENGRVWSDGAFRVTQVLRGDDVLMQAEVQVQAAEPILTLAKGATEWLPVNYRERSYRGDAVLADVLVTGSGADMVVVPTRSEWLVEELWRIVDRAGRDQPWTAPFIAVPIAIATPFVAIAEFFECAFGECPQAHPYPPWMPAGDVGVFYVKVKADRDPGDYDVTVWLQGHNFDMEAFTFQVKVT